MDGRDSLGRGVGHREQEGQQALKVCRCPRKECHSRQSFVPSWFLLQGQKSPRQLTLPFTLNLDLGHTWGFVGLLLFPP